MEETIAPLGLPTGTHPLQATRTPLATSHNGNLQGLLSRGRVLVCSSSTPWVEQCSPAPSLVVFDLRSVLSEDYSKSVAGNPKERTQLPYGELTLLSFRSDSSD